VGPENEALDLIRRAEEDQRRRTAVCKLDVVRSILHGRRADKRTELLLQSTASARLFSIGIEARNLSLKSVSGIGSALKNVVRLCVAAGPCMRLKNNPAKAPESSTLPSIWTVRARTSP